MTTTQTPVALLGLGPMGVALARTLLAEGVPLTVWNRSPAAVDALVVEGASTGAGPTGAVDSAELVLVCLRDHDATREVLASVDPAAYAGRTVVNLSSSTPDQARRTAEWAADRGITYLSGAIMVPTALVGDPSAVILYSGPRSLFDQHVDQLRILAGTADHLGEDHGLASLHDVAMLEIFFAGMTSFLHAAAMATAQGIDAKSFLPYAQQVTALLPDTFAGLAADVDRGSYPGDEDRLTMDLAALEHIADTSAEVGLDGGLPVALRDLARRAVAAGHGERGFSSVVEALRKPSGSQ